MTPNPILRNDALRQQDNFDVILTSTRSWALTQGITSYWGLMHRVVTCAVAGAINTKIYNSDIEDKVEDLLDRAPTPLGNSILADAEVMAPGTTITLDHVNRAIEILANWHVQFFTAELASDVTPGEKGEKGDRGIDGVAGAPGPSGGGAFTFPGAIFFDNLANNDNDRTIAVNKWFQENRRGTVIIPNREIVTQTQLEMWSWFSIMGGVGVPAREYGRCRWRYNGSGSSIFRYVDNKSRQGYPADGSPRDGNVIGIEFVGDKDVIPRTVTLTPGQVLWYWLFENIGGNGIKSFHIGYANGTQYFVGVSHAQGFTSTLLDIGGSENTWFGDKHSFIDSKALPAGAVMLRSKMDKSFIEKVMTTTRGNYIPLEIYGGHATDYNKISFDAQDSDPANQSAILITGGEQIHIMNNKFKGMALGGQPIIDIRSGKQIIIDHNKFVRRGGAGKIGPANTPLVKIATMVADRQVKIGSMNSIGAYDGRVITARAAQVACLDPWMKVEIG